MAKKRNKNQPKSDETAERLVQEVAALVYAAYGFAPETLDSVPIDSPVRTLSREDAHATLIELHLLTEAEFAALPLVAATHMALQRLTDGDIVAIAP